MVSCCPFLLQCISKLLPDSWWFVNIPFMHQMLITCIGTILIIILVSRFEGNRDNPKAIVLSKKLFATSPTFNISAFIVLLITVFLYAFLTSKPTCI